MNISRRVIILKDFDTIEMADDWIDGMIEEYEEDYDQVHTSIKGGGMSGIYEAEVEFAKYDWETVSVLEDTGVKDV